MKYEKRRREKKKGEMNAALQIHLCRGCHAEIRIRCACLVVTAGDVVLEPLYSSMITWNENKDFWDLGCLFSLPV